LKQDRKKLFDELAKVDASGEVHEKCIAQMLEKDSWTLADCPEAEEHGKRLADAIEKCRKIHYPCPMAVIALQQYHFAIQGAKTIKNEGR
jgi:3-hydroxyisobutyrate dehydrogenase